MNGEPHTQAALLLEESTLVRIQQEGGWAQYLV